MRRNKHTSSHTLLLELATVTAQTAIRDLEKMEKQTVALGKLHRLGASRELAAQTVGSAHGPWRLANSPAMNYAF